MTGRPDDASEDPRRGPRDRELLRGRLGRRPGTTRTRGEIVAAARRLFAEKGYDATTIRAIAAEAGVNPALVYHFFQSKDEVFAATLDLPFDPAELIPDIVAGGAPGELGERLVRAFLAAWRDESGRNRALILLRSATTNEQAAAMLRGFMSRQVLDRMAGLLDVPKLRIEAAAAQLVGILLLRDVVRVEPLASAGEDELVALLAPAIQRYLAG